MPFTPIYSFPYPALSDSPNGPAQFQALAQAVESTVNGIDSRLSTAESNIATGPQGPICTVYQSVAQSIPDNAWTAVTFTSEINDSHNMHSTSVNTSRITIPTGWAGYYYCTGIAFFSGGNNGAREATIAVNGIKAVGSATRDDPVDDGFGNGVMTYMTLQLLVGDYVELHCLQNNGAPQNTFAGNPEASSLSVLFQRR
jgi:hypothetical protein